MPPIAWAASVCGTFQIREGTGSTWNRKQSSRLDREQRAGSREQSGGSDRGRGSEWYLICGTSAKNVGPLTKKGTRLADPVQMTFRSIFKFENNGLAWFIEL